VKWKKKLRCGRSFGSLLAMKQFIFLLMPVCLALISCKSGPSRVNANLATIRVRAESGNAKSQNDLGVTYMRLWNATEASKWFQKAAEQGLAEAQYNLAVNFEKGDGLPKDFIEAFAWFSIAAERRNLKAVNGRERLIRIMSQADIEEGKRRAFAYATKMPEKKQDSEITPASTPAEPPKPDSGKKAKLPAPKAE